MLYETTLAELQGVNESAARALGAKSLPVVAKNNYENIRGEFKVQSSLASFPFTPSIMMYNLSREVLYEFGCLMQHPIMKLLNGEPKGYFLCDITKRKDNEGFMQVYIQFLNKVEGGW